MAAQKTAVTFFATPARFRAWLEKNHAKARELYVGFYRKDSGKPSITWPESVDEALAFGWIDGVRKRIDDESYVIRFTPRRASSKWSRINIARVAELTKLGRMAAAGLTVFEARDPEKAKYSYEEQPAELDPRFEKTFRANTKAWAFFTSTPPGYRKLITNWVMDAKKEETRERRLAQLIEHSAKGERVGLLKK